MNAVDLLSYQNMQRFEAFNDYELPSVIFPPCSICARKMHVHPKSSLKPNFNAWFIPDW